MLDNINFQLVDQDNIPINVGIIEDGDLPEKWSARIVIKEDKYIKIICF